MQLIQVFRHALRVQQARQGELRGLAGNVQQPLMLKIVEASHRRTDQSKQAEDGDVYSGEATEKKGDEF